MQCYERNIIRKALFYIIRWWLVKTFQNFYTLRFATKTLINVYVFIHLSIFYYFYIHSYMYMTYYFFFFN